LKADIEKLEAQLVGAEIRASGEAAKTMAAIQAFESLAQRLEAIAEADGPGGDASSVKREQLPILTVP
jgi:hypothetical protein